MYGKPYPLYEVEQLSNLKEVINHIASKYGDKTAFTFERNDETVNISFNQFKADVEALGAALFNMNLKSTKIALLGDNSYEWLVVYFATVNSGNVILPLDKFLTSTEVKNLTDHSESEVFVYSNEYSDIADFLHENNTTVKHYININDLQGLIDKGKSLIQQGEKQIIDYVVNEDVLATLMYTSGTTGNPKGVMLTHKGITKNCVAILRNCFLWESTLLVCPLYHGSGFSGTLGMLISGCQVAINTSLKTLPSDFAKYKPRVIILVPLFIETLYKQILGAAGGNTDVTVLKQITGKVFGGNLEIIVSGGAPLDSKNVDNYLNLGITILNAYGLTETSAIVSISRNNYLKADSVGPILPGFDVKIVDPDENGNGEILTKSEFTMLGYYKNEQATAETIEDGWLKTGDIGFIDEDGFLYVSGRKKNMILLSNGKNVYPEELEFSMQKHIPYIKEVVIYAHDEEIIAEVFFDTDNYHDCAAQLDKDILSFNETQAIFKNINKTIVRDTEFPKTTTRKIKRQYK